MGAGLDRRMLLAGAAAAVLAGRAGAQAQGARWVRGGDLPYAVQEIYPALFRGAIVQAGGFRHRIGPVIWPTASVVAWEGGQWREVADLPDRRHHIMQVAHGSEGREAMLAIGGFTSTPGAIWRGQREVWRLSALDGRWQPGPPLPVPQAESAAGSFPGLVVLAGGRSPPGSANAGYGDHADTGRTLLLRDGRRGWQEGAAMPTPRNSMAFAVLAGRLHVIAGRRSLGPGNIVNLADHHAYDPAADRWVALAPLPAPRGGHAAAVVGGRIHVLGGEAFGDSPTVFREHWSYDPEADRWREEAPMPEGRHGLGAVALAGRLHVIAGASQPGGRGTSPRHDIFAP
ncbi:MAG: Kelch repeat-containing protein [Thermaurantiacus sp.]